MKNAIIVILLLIAASTVFAQAPQGIAYQAIARNSSGTILANHAIRVRFTIRDASATGSIKYREYFTPTTNDQGLFSVSIGTGTVESGSFPTIDWATNAKFLQVQMDPSGGTSYTNMGTQQMMSVPYALYAGTAYSLGTYQKTKITYEAPSGTGAGTAVEHAWTTRPLNTVVYDDIGVTLASNEILLPAGTYEVSATCVFNNANFIVGREKIRIRNITAGTTLGVSLNSSMSVGANFSSYPAHINDERFSLSTPSNIALQYIIDDPEFGVPYATGEKEVYAEVILTKIQ